MDFILLDDYLEKELKKIIDYASWAETFSLSKYKFDNVKIDSLIEKGFLKVEITGAFNCNDTYSLTHNAKHYFDLKKKFLEQQSKEKQKDNRRFWITTGISIGAVIVSIIALVVSIIK